MSKKLLVLLMLFLVFLLAGVSSALAGPSYQSTVTSSPTWDVRTPPSTPTAFTSGDTANFDFACPAGLPDGWGEVIPDASWQVACAHCLPSPTVYPTFDYNMGSGVQTIECTSGVFDCFQYGDDAVVFSGSEGMYETAYGNFSVLQDDTDLYMYYLFSNYTVWDYVHEQEADTDLIVGYSGDFETISYPPANYPTVYDYLFEGATAGEYSMSLSIDSIDGIGVQNMGCTRIYVSTVEITDFPVINCAGYEGGFACDYPDYDTSIGVVLEEVNLVIDDFHGSSSASCYPFLNGLRCDYGMVAEAWTGRTSWNFHFSPIGNFDHYTIYVVGVVDGYTSYDGDQWVSNGVYDYSCANALCWQSFISTNLWLGTGVLTVARLERYYQPFEESFGLFHSAKVGYGGASWVGTIYIFPEDLLFEEINCDDESADPNPEISGSVCDAVVPADYNNDVDFEIFESQPSVCTTIPYLSMWDLLDGNIFGAIITYLAPDFVDFMEERGFMPASTFCYHFVDFKPQYIMNVEVPFMLLSLVMLGVWALRKFTSKGA